MITEEDFELQVIEMLSRRSLDIEDSAVLAVQVLPFSSEPSVSASAPRPSRDRARVMVAALILVIGGAAAFVAVRGTNAEEVATRPSDGGGSLPVFPDDAWDLSVPSAHLFPADFSLGIDFPIFSYDGEASEVIDAYLTDRLAAQSDSFSWQATETSSDSLQALYRWMWTGDSVEGVSPSGWLYLRLKDNSWGIYAATTDGVDMSDLRFTAEAFEGQIVSDSIQSISSSQWILTPPRLVNGVPYESVNTRRGSSEGMSLVGTVGVLQHCVDRVQVKAAQLDLNESFPTVDIDSAKPVSISEHILLNTRADRLDCKLPTFEPGSGDVARNSGPATTEVMPDALDIIESSSDRPGTRLVVDTERLDAELTILEADSYDLRLDSQPDEVSFQSFRVPGDGFDGRIVFIESNNHDNEGFNAELATRYESIKMDGLDIYIVESPLGTPILTGSLPTGGWLTVTGIGMKSDELVNFVRSLSQPVPGERSWQLTEPTDGLVQAYERPRVVGESSLIHTRQSTRWVSNGHPGSLLLTLESGEAASSEARLLSVTHDARTTVTRQLIADRLVFVVSDENGDVAIWKENDQVHATLVVPSGLGLSTRQVMESLIEVNEDGWLQLTARAQANAAAR